MLRLRNDFADFFLRFRSMVGLITKLRKEIIITLIYLIKLLNPKQNMGIKSVFKILITPNLFVTPFARFQLFVTAFLFKPFGLPVKGRYFSVTFLNLLS